MSKTTFSVWPSLNAGIWMDGFLPLIQVWKPGHFKLEAGLMRNYFGFECMAFSHIEDSRTWARIQLAIGLYYGLNLYIHFPAQQIDL